MVWEFVPEIVRIVKNASRQCNLDDSSENEEFRLPMPPSHGSANFAACATGHRSAALRAAALGNRLDAQSRED